MGAHTKIIEMKPFYSAAAISFESGALESSAVWVLKRT